jgi:hypothetical protein
MVACIELASTCARWVLSLREEKALLVKAIFLVLHPSKAVRKDLKVGTRLSTP